MKTLKPLINFPTKLKDNPKKFYNIFLRGLERDGGGV